MNWVSLVLLGIFCRGEEKAGGLFLQAGYQVEYFSQSLDHINGDPGLINIRTFIKYGNPNAPLFVYAGGEGALEDFFEMTGWLVYTLGPYYGATVIFIEHRYYGDSLPLVAGYQYLNTDQVLLDFANIVLQVKPSETTPVVVFGGSYGGMLAAFFRIKFPHIVDGAIASSGPVLEYLDSAGQGLMHTVTQVYYSVYPGCAFNINDAFNILDNFVQNEYTWSGVSAVFQTCAPITEQQQILALEDWIADALEAFAQLNYPYPTTLDGGIPGYPINVACSLLAATVNPNNNMWQKLQGLYQIVNLYYNNTGTASCFSPWAASSPTDPWSYQTCSELLFPIGQYGVPNDMFPARPFVLSEYSAECQSTFGVSPNLQWYPINYGFTAFYTDSLKYLSNVVFSYGTVDPWQSGCLKESPNPNVQIVGIKNGAHHFDLRRPNPNDPISVIFARNLEQKEINQWIGWTN